jgi:hypothetical protein
VTLPWIAIEIIVVISVEITAMMPAASDSAKFLVVF